MAHALGRDPILHRAYGNLGGSYPDGAQPVGWSGVRKLLAQPERVHQRLAGLRPVSQDLNEAHNGYIEVYLELGWVGVGLIAIHID